MYIGFNATTPLASDFVVPAICGKDRVNRKNKNHVIEDRGGKRIITIITIITIIMFF